MLVGRTGAHHVGFRGIGVSLFREAKCLTGRAANHDVFMATVFYAARSRALLIRELKARKELPLTDLTP